MDYRKRIGLFETYYGHGNIAAEILFNHKDPEVGDVAIIFSLDSAGYTRAFAIITARNINYPDTLDDIRIYFENFEIKLSSDKLELFHVDEMDDLSDAEELKNSSEEEDTENGEENEDEESSEEESEESESEEEGAEEEQNEESEQNSGSQEEWVVVDDDSENQNSDSNSEEPQRIEYESPMRDEYYSIFYRKMNAPYKVFEPYLRDRTKYSTYIILEGKTIKIGRNSRDNPYSTITINKNEILIEKFSDIVLDPDNCGIESEGEEDQQNQNQEQDASGSQEEQSSEGNSGGNEGQAEERKTYLRSLVEINRDRIRIKKVEKVEDESSLSFYSRTELDMTDNDIYMARNYIKDGALQMKANFFMDCQNITFAMYDKDEKLRARTRLEEEKAHFSLYNQDETVVSSIIVKPDKISI
ncbi:MAG: hypothetical protein NZZ41_07495, partial [Candidatus Dojkabacteria bacterium]|nr:hypothetical protein [Candidatus Dojkabacteria bacterium]